MALVPIKIKKKIMDLLPITAFTGSEWWEVSGAGGKRGSAAQLLTYIQAAITSALTKADVGLGNVDNTSDAEKPVSTLQQAVFDTKKTLAAAATGTEITFTTDKVFGSVTTPETANITTDLNNAKIGVVQKIYHNAGIAPTFPAGWVKLGSGIYTTSTLNVIYCEWVSGTRVEYWVTQ